MSFVEDQIAVWAGLCGRVVRGWSGVEMALREPVGGNPEFTDDTITCLQFATLDCLTPGLRTRIATYQNDDTCGLLIKDGVVKAVEPSRFGCIYRVRDVHEFPAGRISEVHIALDAVKGDVAEVRVCVSSREMVIVAGELYEQVDGCLDLVHGDESVLVFPDATAAEEAPWRNQRQLKPQLQFPR